MDHIFKTKEVNSSEIERYAFGRAAYARAARLELKDSKSASELIRIYRKSTSKSKITNHEVQFVNRNRK